MQNVSGVSRQLAAPRADRHASPLGEAVPSVAVAVAHSLGVPPVRSRQVQEVAPPQPQAAVPTAAQRLAARARAVFQGLGDRMDAVGQWMSEAVTRFCSRPVREREVAQVAPITLAHPLEALAPQSPTAVADSKAAVSSGDFETPPPVRFRTLASPGHSRSVSTLGSVPMGGFESPDVPFRAGSHAPYQTYLADWASTTPALGAEQAESPGEPKAGPGDSKAQASELSSEMFLASVLQFSIPVGLSEQQQETLKKTHE